MPSASWRTESGKSAKSGDQLAEFLVFPAASDLERVVADIDVAVCRNGGRGDGGGRGAGEFDQQQRPGACRVRYA